MDTLTAFLLTRQWRDTPKGLELCFWGKSANGPVRVARHGEKAVCFVDRERRLPGQIAAHCERRALDLAAFSGSPVDGLYFVSQRELNAARSLAQGSQLQLHEADVNPADRYLMERFITASFTARGSFQRGDGYLASRDASLHSVAYEPELSYVAIDIETSGLDGALYSIAVSGLDQTHERVFMVAPGETLDAYIACCADERSVVEAFFAWLREYDPDVLLGWNVINFDLDFLERKCQALGIPFALGRGGDRSTILQPQSSGGIRVARVPGRAVLDGIDTLRAAFWSFESFELDAVAKSLLGRGKTLQDARDKVNEIRRMYAHDKPRLAAYNLEDCRLVVEIFEKTGLIRFAVRRAQLTGLPMDRHGGSVAAFDNLYLPRLHRKGRVAPEVGATATGDGSPGGYVMDSKPGLYDNVLVLDFKSLYPSIIRTFRVDPFGLVQPGEDPVPGFEGAVFAREGSILPELIEELWAARDAAKHRADAALSQAVKIIMNSFYGVLGATGCRFLDSRLTSSITRRGHEILKNTGEFIEARGHPVIYGDTDSVFVLLGSSVDVTTASATGNGLAKDLNAWWRARIQEQYRLASYLEIEFETHYLRFLMPTVRGAATGSKKRYAGLVRTPEGAEALVFKGLESVRTDWTPLARRFQRELYRRVFCNEPFEDFVRHTLAELLDGKLDEELVYRKRLRRAIDDYTRNVPPHVQAAKKLKHPGRWVRYVITAGGAEPVTDHIPVPDYEHYRQRQLAPVANSILHFLDTSFEAITDKQLEIF